MFRRGKRESAKQPAGPPGYRAYVVGDVHGRLDLLESLLTKIHAELRRRPSEKTLLAFVGDLIDRGPSSAQVIERLRTYQMGGVETAFLLGNHEEVLLRVIAGDEALAWDWLRFGGLECLESYGVEPAQLRRSAPDQVVELARVFIPQTHIAFIESFHDTWSFGDYLFVHAGIRPGVSLDCQARADVHWIREPFLSSATNHGAVIIHGHTITELVDEKPNRIGIDTGAYRTGVLTVLGIEGVERWIIESRGN